MPEIETYTPAQLETEVQTLAENYRGAVAEIAEDDGYFDDISTAIQGKTGQAEPYAKNEMAGAIANISTIPEKPDPNGALLLMDWEGTILQSYTHAEAMALEALPNVEDTQYYQSVDHDLLVFQEWNWSLVNIKAWIQAHEGRTLDVGAIYTTTDGQDHNYWGNPRLDTESTINMQKRATASIGNYAFQYCRSLTQVNIPNGVTRIGYYAFPGCVSLSSINIPNGVTSIETSAFQDCYSLASINIPNGVTSIGTSAFQNCYSLASINIPDSVTRIGNNAFQGCVSLTSINIPDGVTRIGNNTFQYCYSLTQVNIPNGVTSIEDYAFQDCHPLTSINIPDSVTRIGNNAFQGCVSFTQVNIPNSVTRIGNNAFQYCRSLTQVNIPDSVTRIGNNTFQYCNSLCDVLLESKPTLTNTNAFSDLPANYRIYVPRSYLSWFETATNWSSIYTAHIVAIEDYINYLESLGFDVDKYKEVTA